MNTPTTTERLTFDAFSRVGAAWNDMVAAAAAASPFLTHQWVCTWWRHFGEGLDFVAPVVRAGDVLLAGVPLVLRRVRAAGIPVTVAEIVGTSPVPTRGMGLADKADLLCRAQTPGALATLAGEVSSLLDTADVLDLKGVDQASGAAPALASTAEGARMRTLARSVSPYVVLTGTWESFLRSQSRNFRGKLKKHGRRLAAAGEVELTAMGPGDDAAAWMQEAMAINAESWKAERGTDLFRHPVLRAFLLDLAVEMAGAGMLDLHMLRIGGRPVAYELCFDVANRVFSYNSSFDRKLAHCSPGTVVTAAVIEAAFARGRTEYDLLRGDEGYKSRWSDTAHTELQLVLPAARLRGRAYASVAIGMKARLKQIAWLNELDDRVSGGLSRLRHKR